MYSPARMRETVASDRPITVASTLLVRPSWLDTAICSGTVPKAYQTNPVMPAQNAAMLKSRRYDIEQCSRVQLRHD